MLCPQIWNIEQEKDREKEKVSYRPAKLNEKKADTKRTRARDKKKKQRRHFLLLEEQHENFVAAVTNPSGHQCQVKMSAVKKKGTKTSTTFSPKRV